MKRTVQCTHNQAIPVNSYTVANFKSLMKSISKFALASLLTATVGMPCFAFEVSPKKYGDILKEELSLCGATRTEEYI